MEITNTPIPPQQWELLASPGRVLLEQVNIYRLKTKGPIRLIYLAIAICVAAIFVSPYVGIKSGEAVAWVIEKINKLTKPSPYPKSPAATISQLVPVLPGGTFDIGIIPGLQTDVAPAMLAQVDAMKAGKKMEDCDFTKKITEPWFDGKDSTPKCRYSKDGSRLWTWAYVKQSQYQHGPFVGLIMRKDDKVTYSNIDAPGTLRISGMPTINPALLPRAVAADFPELLGDRK